MYKINACIKNYVLILFVCFILNNFHFLGKLLLKEFPMLPPIEYYGRGSTFTIPTCVIIALHLNSIFNFQMCSSSHVTSTFISFIKLLRIFLMLFFLLILIINLLISQFLLQSSIFFFLLHHCFQSFFILLLFST